jgi:membrane protein required for colicin V production
VEHIAALDWIFLAVLLLSMTLGLWRGLVYEVLSLLSWVAAFFAAQWLAQDVGEWLPLASLSAPLRYAAGFATVFIAALFAGGFVAWLVQKALAAIGLRPVDRVLGGVFGLLRGLVLVLVITVAAQLASLQSHAQWQASQGAQIASAALKGLRPLLPSEAARFLP